MLQKNIDKQKRKERKTWVGLFPRKTSTKKQLEKKIQNKNKGKTEQY